MIALVTKALLALLLVSLVTGTETEEWFEQRIDHFNNLVTGSFKQKYYVLNDYYKPSDPPSPIFLYINGEGKGNLRFKRATLH